MLIFLKAIEKNLLKSGIFISCSADFMSFKICYRV